MFFSLHYNWKVTCLTQFEIESSHHFFGEKIFISKLVICFCKQRGLNNVKITLWAKIYACWFPLYKQSMTFLHLIFDLNVWMSNFKLKQVYIQVLGCPKTTRKHNCIKISCFKIWQCWDVSPSNACRFNQNIPSNTIIETTWKY